MEDKYTLFLQFSTSETILLAYNWLIDTELTNSDQLIKNFEITENLKGVDFNQTCIKDSNQIQNRTQTGSVDWRINKYSILRMEKDNFAFTKDRKNDNDYSIISQYLGDGIIHLFKESEVDKNFNNNNNNAENNYNNDYSKNDMLIEDNNLLIIPGDDTMVSILFVPTYFTIHDLLHFYIGDDIIQNQITNFRILKNLNNDIGFNFMVLIKFKTMENAKLFKDKFNGKSFTKMDPEKCHVVYVNKIFLQKNLFTNAYNDIKDLPYLLTDPFTQIDKTLINNNTDILKKNIELPTCPVCLERLDSDITGLITIPCQHTFHCHCLDRWKNSNCPVCRFSSFRISRDNLINKPSHQCYSCQESNYNNLWICLICGNIGCSRYNLKHAINHYEATQHCFAMDLKTQRVWDYAGDNYVHRIVQNEIDGKLVEVSVQSNNDNSNNNGNIDNASSANNNDTNGKNLNDKLSYNINNKEYHLEYVQLLISQLESQREYYESKIQQITEVENDKDEKIQNLQMDNEKNNELIQLKAKENEENKLMIKGMLQNLDKLEKKNENLQTQMTKLNNDKVELEHEVKDLMFYLDTQSKFENASDDEKNGQIITVGGDSGTSSSKNQKKKKKKKKVKKIVP